MNDATVGPWTASVGTTRKNVGLRPSVSAGFVAEPDRYAICADAKSGPAAATSWEDEISAAMTPESEVTACACRLA